MPTSDVSAALLHIIASFDHISSSELIEMLMDVTPGATLSDVRDGLSELSRKSLVVAESGVLTPTSAAKEVGRKTRRLSEANALKRLRLAIDDRPSREPVEVAWLSAEAWSFGVDAYRSRVRFKLETRHEVVATVLDALGRLDEVNAAVRASLNRRAARDALVAPPFGYTEFAAQHVLDMTVSRQTADARAELEAELLSLEADLLRHNSA